MSDNLGTHIPTHPQHTPTTLTDESILSNVITDLLKTLDQALRWWFIKHWLSFNILQHNQFFLSYLCYFTDCKRFANSCKFKFQNLKNIIRIKKCDEKSRYKSAWHVFFFFFKIRKFKTRNQLCYASNKNEESFLFEYRSF